MGHQMAHRSAIRRSNAIAAILNNTMEPFIKVRPSHHMEGYFYWEMYPRAIQASIPYMINMTGPVATLHVDGGSFTSNHPVTQLVKWQADLTHGGELTLHNVKGNGNYNIGPGTSGLPVMVGTPFTIFPGVHIISQFNDDGFVVNGS
jgi:hypothetical protein